MRKKTVAKKCFSDSEFEDPEMPLRNLAHEEFCHLYIELSKEIANDRCRLITAYRQIYDIMPSAEPDAIMYSRAKILLKRYEVVERIKYLLAEQSGDVEAATRWCKGSSITELKKIILSEETKPADKINAIRIMGTLLEEERDEEEEETGALDKFFRNLKDR